MSYESEVLADSPSLFLRLGDTSGTTAAPVSPTTIAGTYTGTCTLNQTGPNAGDSTKAVLLPGSGGNNIDAGTALNAIIGTGDYTIEMQVKFNAFPTDTDYLHPAAYTGLFGAGITDVGMTSAIPGGTLWFYFYPSTDLGSRTNVKYNASAWTTGVWYHLTARYTQANTGAETELFVNGVSVATLSNPGAPISWTGMYAGAAAIGDRTNGTFANIVVYNHSVSTTRILAHYTASQTASGPTAGSATSYGSTSSAASLTVGAASGGTSPYTYQWYRSTSSGFTPGGGNIISGATSRDLLDTGLTANTTYYYKNVATDSASATATSSELTVTTANGVDVAPNNANIFYPVGGWVVSSSKAVAINLGQYFKLKFTGTTSCKLAFDNLSFGTETAYPTIAWTLDDGAWQTATLNSSTFLVTIGTGLGTGAHTLKVVFNGNTGALTDRWNTPQFAVKFFKVALGSGGSLSAPSLATKQLLVYGDSIAEDGGIGDPKGTFASLIGPGLDAEYSVCAFSGQGWARAAGSGNVPDFSSTWNYNWSGQARSFSTQPNYILIAEGVNDSFGPSSGQVTTSITTVLPALRAANPTAWIFVLMPFSNYTSSTITSAFNAYQASTPDTKCKLITVPALSVTGFPQAGLSSATWQTVDSIHPNTVAHGAMAAAVTKLIADAIGVGTRAFGF